MTESEKYQKLLEFVKSLAWLNRWDDEDIKEYNDQGFYLEAKEARDLLREMGEGRINE